MMSGSLDWTYAAVEQGNVNVVISKNRELCDDFTLEFDRFDRVWETIFQERTFSSTCWLLGLQGDHFVFGPIDL